MGYERGDLHRDGGPAPAPDRRGGTGGAHSRGPSGSGGQGATSPDGRKKKRLKRWQKVALGAGIPVAILLIAVAVLFSYLSSLDKNMALDGSAMKDLEGVLAQQPASPTEPYYVLVLGSDAREGETASRSDTIMLCRLDPGNKRVSILSIPRDTKVELEGYGTQKINAAMAYEGPAGAVKAVSSFVGVEIAHVALIDFAGFSGIVDALGGVTVDVPLYTEFDGIELQPGVQTLNGAQALAFARCRMEYGLGDFQRAANQRILLKAVASQVMQASPTEIPSLVSTLTTSVGTDLKVTDLVGLVGGFRGMSADADIYTGQVPSTTDTIDGISYVITLEDQWAGVREKFVGGEVPFVDSSNQPGVID
jgi:LCP family protein required for cell wall assembly